MVPGAPCAFAAEDRAGVFLAVLPDARKCKGNGQNLAMLLKHVNKLRNRFPYVFFSQDADNRVGG